MPFLEYAWSFDSNLSLPLNEKRVLATDLGVINLTASVICKAGSQISRPMFWSAKKSVLHKLDQHYHAVCDPYSKILSKTGRFFACPQCGYSANRDYLGALNIYRMYQEQRKNRYSIQSAKPLSYTGSGIPCNRPPGVSVQVFLNG